MIKLSNKSEFLVTLQKSGAAAVANNVAYFVSPFDGFIKGIKAAFAQAGVDGTGAPTQDVRVDIKKNGASIFASAATSIIWAHANIATNFKTPVVNAPSTDPTAISKGDVIRVDITQILNGTSPTQPLDLQIDLVLQRKFQSPRATLLNQITSLD